MVPKDAEAKLAAVYVSRESLNRLERYTELLVDWQSRINLVGPATIQDIWIRHILDSAQLLKLMPAGCRTIADLGSGAGLPGLVLAIAGGYHSHLIEANGKKCAFLREAARVTGAMVSIHQMRLEDLKTWSERPRVDVVTSRALAPLTRLLDFAWPFLVDGSLGLFHKGQDVDAELTEAIKCRRICYVKRPSVTDSRGVILEIKEAGHAERQGGR